MRRYIEVHQMPPIMLDHDEDVQDLENPVGTVKKSMETNCFEWFVRNVRHVCDGGFECRTMYLLIDDSETSMPSFRSSLRIRGSPRHYLG